MGARSAPRRQVLEIWKTGDYGTTIWHHRLECGHVEERKRRRPSDEIGCVRCEMGEGLERLTAPGAPDPADSVDLDAAVLRAHLASGLGVPLDAVSIQMSGGRLVGALVVLDRWLIDEIANR